MQARVAIYARISTQDGRQDAENQLAQLREYAERRGWAVQAEYVDEESGAKANRPKFRRLFEDAHRRRFDLLLFWSLDRFSREGATATLKHLERLNGYGVGWKSLTQEYLDSTGPFAEAIIAIMAAVAAQERQVLSDRTKAGLQRAKRQGKPIGRPRKILDRTQAWRLRAEGLSYRLIGERLGVSAMHAYRICRDAPHKAA